MVSSTDHAPCVPPGAAFPVDALNADRLPGGTAGALGAGAGAAGAGAGCWGAGAGAGAGTGVGAAEGGAGVPAPLLVGWGAGVVLAPWVVLLGLVSSGMMSH